MLPEKILEALAILEHYVSRGVDIEALHSQRLQHARTAAGCIGHTICLVKERSVEVGYRRHDIGAENHGAVVEPSPGALSSGMRCQPHGRASCCCNHIDVVAAFAVAVEYQPPAVGTEKRIGIDRRRHCDAGGASACGRNCVYVAFIGEGNRISVGAYGGASHPQRRFLRCRSCGGQKGGRGECQFFHRCGNRVVRDVIPSRVHG